MADTPNSNSPPLSEQTPLLLDGPADHHRDASSHNSTHELNHNPTLTPLQKYRNAIGINVSSLSSDPHELETARSKPSGIYKQIIAIQRSRDRQYYAFEYFYYFALVLQILIGATLAALGSLSPQHPTTITILGVLNTATAGLLALLKGQGLPDRLRKDAYEMKKVQDFIEETDIRLALFDDGVWDAGAEEGQRGGGDGGGGMKGGGLEAEVRIVVERIFEMYNVARDTAEMNHPSNYAHQVDGAGVDSPAERGAETSRGRARGDNSVGHDGSVDGEAGIRGVRRWVGSGNGMRGVKGKGKLIIE